MPVPHSSIPPARWTPSQRLRKPERSRSGRNIMLRLVNRGLDIVASPSSNRVGIGAMKIAIAIIFLWIGFLKFQPYEADSITPFVANSPVMSFFYEHPKEYKPHLTKEGELKPEQRNWQAANNTYG